MTDPWEDVRERVRISGMTSEKELLADADALLAVVRELPAFVPGIGVELTSSLDAAYAALPEHLK